MPKDSRGGCGRTGASENGGVGNGGDDRTERVCGVKRSDWG